MAKKSTQPDNNAPKLSKPSKTSEPPPSPPPPKNAYIYINGFPGVGKLTIATALTQLSSNCKVYHNHLLIDPVAGMVSRFHTDYHGVRTSIRRYILDIIATSDATSGVTWVFTDSRGTSRAHRDAARDYEKAAKKRGVPFVSVVVECGLEENIRRATSEERGKGDTKLTDPVRIRDIRDGRDNFWFGGPRELVLDVAELEAVEAAIRIAGFANGVVGGCFPGIEKREGEEVKTAEVEDGVDEKERVDKEVDKVGGRKKWNDIRKERRKVRRNKGEKDSEDKRENGSKGKV